MLENWVKFTIAFFASKLLSKVVKKVWGQYRLDRSCAGSNCVAFLQEEELKRKNKRKYAGEGDEGDEAKNKIGKVVHKKKKGGFKGRR